MERIRKTGDYRRVYESGTKLHGRHLMLFFTGSDHPEIRVGITVSGKVGGACVRNRAKRRIREAIKTEMAERQDLTHKDLVFVAKSGVKDASFESIQKDIRALLKKATR